MNFNIIMNQIAVLFIIIFTGFFLNKKDIIDDHTSKKISSLIVNVTAPLLVINAMTQKSNLKPADILLVLGISNVLYLLVILSTFFIPKLMGVKKEDMGIYKFMLVFANVVFMGFPVISVFFGESALVYAAIFNLPFSLYAYTLGIYFVSSSGDSSSAFNWKKMINAGVLSVFIGLIFLFSGIKIPSFIGDTMNMIGGLTTPLSMLIIGASLAHVKMKALFTNIKLYIYCIIKLLIFPIIVFFGLSAMGISGDLLGVSVVLSGMPAAANTVMMSKEYGGNDILAAEGVFISTMISAITIPILAVLLTYF